jgi:UDP-N-acetylmuramate dehydrogenase
MVICTQRLRGYSFGEESVRVSAGESLCRLLDAANHNGIRSLNFLAGIPGSLGGAITMNAGIRQQSIGAIVTEVAVLDPAGNTRVLQQRDCEFAYRQSLFRTQHIPVLWAQLRLNGEWYDRDAIRTQRLAHQPVFPRSAGCVFKNPPGHSAGRLIDKAGLKGTMVGMAKVSEKHANFILNLGGASSAEIRKLIDIVRQKVYKSFRILLEPEIEVIDG